LEAIPEVLLRGYWFSKLSNRSHSC